MISQSLDYNVITGGKLLLLLSEGSVWCLWYKDRTKKKTLVDIKTRSKTESHEIKLMGDKSQIHSNGGHATRRTKQVHL